MEDTHICITDLAKKFSYKLLDEEAVSFYGVSSSPLLIFCFNLSHVFCFVLFFCLIV